MSATLIRPFGSSRSVPVAGGTLPGEGSVMEDAGQIFASAEAWMRQPHPELAGQSPAECLASGDEESVRALLRRIRYAPVA